MGSDIILHCFLCSLGNYLILLVLCQFSLVLGNFTYRKGCSFPERGTRCWQQSACCSVDGTETHGHLSLRCGARTAEWARFHPSDSPSILRLLARSPDVARMCASGAASLGGDEKRVMHQSDMLNFPQRWCSHNNIFPADGVHVSLPFHWSSVTHWDVVGACVHLLFPEPSLPFWGG